MVCGKQWSSVTKRNKLFSLLYTKEVFVFSGLVDYNCQPGNTAAYFSRVPEMSLALTFK